MYNAYMHAHIESTCTHKCTCYAYEKECLCTCVPPTCMHTYIHTYIHTHIHTYIHTYTCLCTCDPPLPSSLWQASPPLTATVCASSTCAKCLQCGILLRT